MVAAAAMPQSLRLVEGTPVAVALAMFTLLPLRVITRLTQLALLVFLAINI